MNVFLRGGNRLVVSVSLAIDDRYIVLFNSLARALGRGLGTGKASVPRVNMAHYCITIQLLFLVYVFNATSDLTNSYLCELEKFANAFKRR